jgi:hypothetical protein
MAWACPQKIQTQTYALHNGSVQPMVVVVPDDRWPGMYRLACLDDQLSDMANLSRAKDAAVAICERGPPRRNQHLLQWKICPVRDAQNWPLVRRKAPGAP